MRFPCDGLAFLLITGTVVQRSVRCVCVDVYSYAEDDMVIDPLLADHLAHFGIDIMSMKKVVKVVRHLAMSFYKVEAGLLHICALEWTTE